MRSLFRLTILAWLAVHIDRTATLIILVSKIKIIIIIHSIKTTHSIEMILDPIQVNSKITFNSKMILGTEIIRGTVTWLKLTKTNIKIPTTLKTNFKTKQASSKDIQWVNCQVSKLNKNSLSNLKPTFNNSL
jgi:hypothetical protein